MNRTVIVVGLSDVNNGEVKSAPRPRPVYSGDITQLNSKK